MNHPAPPNSKPAPSKPAPSNYKQFSKPLRLGGTAHLPPPELPIPNAEEVARFQSLFLTRFGVELSEEEAHDQARRLVQFVFLMQHALPSLNEAKSEYKAESKKVENKNWIRKG